MRNANAVNAHSVNPSTLRVRRHRERRREGLCLFAVEVPEATIEEARARGLLPPQERTKAWKVIQSCYAAQLSDAVLDWLEPISKLLAAVDRL